jgi:hypothetical protein
MTILSLVEIQDTSGKVTGKSGSTTFQALTDQELDALFDLESAYSHIGREFSVKYLGDVQVPSMEGTE